MLHWCLLVWQIFSYSSGARLLNSNNHYSGHWLTHTFDNTYNYFCANTHILLSLHIAHLAIKCNPEVGSQVSFSSTYDADHVLEGLVQLTIHLHHVLRW